MSERFWLLRPPERRHADWDKGNLWRKSDYPESVPPGPFIGCGGPAKRINEFRIVLTTKKSTDFIWTTSECTIQDRVMVMLKDQGFSGFDVRPAHARMKIRAKDYDPRYDDDDAPGVKERDALKIQIPKLWELQVTGWGGVAHPDAGMKPIPGTLKWAGQPNWAKFVDESQWDGSDFFFVWPLPLFRIVTDRVAQFIRKHKLSGVKLIEIDRNPDYMKKYFDGACPGRLSDYLPDERAREIGEPLGIY